MSKDTMNPQDAFKKVAQHWHPILFAEVFVWLLYVAVDFDEASPVMTWIQFRLPLLTPGVFQIMLLFSGIVIHWWRPAPRVMAVLMLPAMTLAAGTIWYIFTHETSWIEALFILVSFFSIAGVIVLSAAWGHSREIIAALMQRTADLERRLEAEGKPDATSA